MRSAYRSCFLFLAAAAASVLPSPSTAAVRVELRNGRTIIAEECREADGALKCFRMGGSFVIEKSDIASVTETSGSGTPEEETFPSAQTEMKDGAAGSDKTAGSEKPAAEARARLDRLTARKRELLPEREKLVGERERLREEVKKAPDWMTADKYTDLKKRLSSLDERIKGFNDKVKELNKEEKTILDSMKNTKPESPEAAK